jgi:hypothetical protein
MDKLKEQINRKVKEVLTEDESDIKNGYTLQPQS